LILANLKRRSFSDELNKKKGEKCGR